MYFVVVPPPCSVTVGVYLLGFRFPGNKLKMLIYDNVTKRFKLSNSETKNPPGTTGLDTGKTHITINVWGEFLQRFKITFWYFAGISVITTHYKPDMTVTYSLEVANARFGGFTKLLFRWKGSIYRLLYKELLVFCGVYLFFSVCYRYLPFFIL